MLALSKQYYASQNLFYYFLLTSARTELVSPVESKGHLCGLHHEKTSEFSDRMFLESSFCYCNSLISSSHLLSFMLYVYCRAVRWEITWLVYLPEMKMGILCHLRPLKYWMICSITGMLLLFLLLRMRIGKCCIVTEIT